MRFGRLTVVAETEKSKDGKIQWLCHCDCGNDSIVKTEKLIGGFTKSCGCLSKEVPHLLKHRNEVYVEGTNLDMLHDRLPKNNNSGVRGVCFVNATQKWKAQLSVQGKKVLNKSYVNKQDAIDARKEAEAKYFRPILEKYKDK